MFVGPFCSTMRPSRFRTFLATALIVTFLVGLLGYNVPVGANYPNYPLEHGFGGRSGQGNRHGHYRLSERSHGRFVFGVDGRDGRDGRRGRSAQNETDRNIDLVNRSAAETFYDFSGTDGEPGEDGTPGERAQSCQVPHRPAYSLVGADGGDGGDGGSGGDGGDGSNVSIYYEDIAALRQVAIANAGGRGGRSGRGDVGADGCECVEPAWVVKFCEWEVWRQQNSVEGQTEASEWEYASRKIEPCMGVRSVDMQEYAPHIEHRDYVPHGYSIHADDYHYDLRYGGVAQVRSFGCQDGDHGKSGSNGRDGTDGDYGRFRLIPSGDIPQEQVEYSGSLSAQLGQTVELVKNIWEQKTGLRSLLSPTSNTPDSYTYLKSTERPKYRLEWAAADTPEKLGVVDVSTSVVARPVGDQVVLDLTIPGTLDYTLSDESGVKVAKITGGFSPTRVESFEVEKIFAKEGESELVLVDKGDLRNLLSETTIEIALLTKQSASGLASETYQPRHEATFYIRRGTEPIDSDNFSVVDNIYAFGLGKRFRPWLKPGYDALYRVNIHQTTNSGAIYTQTEEIPFQVDLGAS